MTISSGVGWITGFYMVVEQAQGGSVANGASLYSF